MGDRTVPAGRPIFDPGAEKYRGKVLIPAGCSLPGGGGTGNALVKASSLDYDVAWQEVTCRPVGPTCPWVGYAQSVQIASATPIVVSGNHAYIGSFFDEYVTTWNIADPSTLAQLQWVTDPALGYLNDMALSGTTLFATSENGYVVSIDVSNPNAPSIISVWTAPFGYSFDGIAISGTVAFLANWGDDAITALDISNPASMSEISSLQDLTFFNGAYGIRIVGNIAVMTAVSGTNYVSTIDISNPAAMVRRDSVTDASFTDLFQVAVDGNTAYVSDYQANGGRVHSIDITDPTNISILDTLTHPSISGPIGISVDPANARLYVASAWNPHVVGISIANPAAMAVTGFVTDATYITTPWGITHQGDYVYVADNDGRFYSIEKACLG